MAESVGQIGLDLVINQNGFNKQMSGITSLAKKAGSTLAAAFAVKKLVDFSKQCIELGSDLAEVQNVVDVTFSTMSKKVDEFAKSAASSFGLSETMAKQYTGTFGAMAKAFGFSESAAYEMSTALTGLAGDVASFYNITQDEAYTKLKSVFTGETESLKDLGVVMTQSALDAYALANGYGKTTAKMSEAERVALRYAFVQNQLATASGDFARTSDGWANQVRLLSLQFDSLKASIGQGLINAFLPVIKVMNVLLGKIQSVASAFANLTAKVFGKAQSTASGVAETVGDVGSAVSDTTSSAVSGVGDSAKAATAAAKKAKSAATSIDELNIISDDDSSGGSGGGGGSGAGGAGTELADVPGAVEEDVETPMEKALTKIKKLVDEIGKSFTEGFTSRFNKINFQPILSGIQSIGKSLNNIFTDVDVTTAAYKFVLQFANTVGSNIANFISIGNSIATNLVNGVAAYLENNAEFIKERLISMFDTGTRFMELSQKFCDFLADITSIATGDSGTLITESIVSIFSNSILSIGDLFIQFATDFASMIIDPLLANKSGIEEAINNTLKPVSKVCKTISDVVNDTWKKIFEVYDTYVKPAFVNFSSGISKIVKAVLDAYNNNFAPVFNNLADKFKTLVSEHLQPMIDKFIEFAGKVVWAVSEIWDKTLSPFIAWFIANVMPVIKPVIETLGIIIMNLYTVISEMISSTINVLQNVIDFIVAVFTGNWEAAWTAIKNIIVSIFDAIKNVVTTVWTAIKNTITTVINAIKAVITTVFNAIKTFISTVLNTIKSLFSSIWNGIKTTVTNVVTGIKNSVISIIDAMKTGISTALGNIRSKFVTVFTAIKNTVSEIFTGLWNNIKGVINSILSGIEKMANGIIKGINSAISALNNLSFDVPDWIPGIGGKTFGFDIPTLSTITIPKLSQGGYVKANTPQLAMIGDNRHQGEVVAPEDKLLEMALKAAELSKDDSNGSNELLRLILEMLKEILSAILGIDVTAEIDGRTLLTMIRNEEARGGYSMSR
jgi:phage-related protein